MIHRPRRSSDALAVLEHLNWHELFDCCLAEYRFSRLRQDLDNAVELLAGGDKGRREVEDISSQAAEQAPPLDFGVELRANLLFRLEFGLGRFVFDKLDRTYQAFAPNIPDMRLVGQRALNPASR